MRSLSYRDSLGRLFKVELPDDAPDSEARYGFHVGPPLLDHLDLPLETQVRLHNELFNRGILTPGDAKRRRSEIVAALSKVLAVDAEKVVEAYNNG